MGLELGCTPSATLGMQPLPALVSYAALLQLPTDGLEQLVDRELGDNPALERVDPPLPHRARTPVDPADLISAGDDDFDRLRGDARLGVPAADRPLVDHVVASLDDRGRLTADVPEMAAATGADPACMIRALRAVQAAGTPGVGSRDLRECLELQLDARAGADTRGQDLAVVRAVIAGHLEGLAAGRYAHIAADLGVTTDAVRRAGEVIRRELRPFVALRRRTWPPGVPDCRPALRVDVVFVRSGDGGLRVVLPEEERFSLRLDPAYRRAAGGPDARRDPLVREHVERARGLVHRLQQRWLTMRAVAEEIGSRQRQFLLAASACPRPMTRAAVALSLGVHESTVSRAVGGRHVLLPSGRTIAMADLFDVAAAGREAVRRVIAAESRPLTDGEIARLASTDGVPMARRTAAKYRAELGLPAHCRR